MGRKKSIIKICIFVLIIGLISFSDWSFASEDELILKNITFFSNFFVAILSWIWVLFAKLAGTFLTNSWVYGEELSLDVILWTYWNVIKNMANYGLGFYFVYKIFAGLISQGKGSIMENLKKEIVWMLIAGVGIQLSWFFTAVVIDTSTVTLAAAGAFPSQIISENEKVQKNIKERLTKLSTGKKITLFPRDAKASNFIEVKDKEADGSIDFDKFLDEMMPNSKDVAGPLYFMGYTLLETDHVPSIDTSSEKGLEATFLNTFIHGATTIVYDVEMFVLCVLALMRMIYLWMFIVLSPMVVLLTCLKYSGGLKDKKAEGFVSSFSKQLNLKSFFINVFKPTIIVLGLGISVIFVSQMGQVIDDYTGKTLNIRGTDLSDTKESTDNVNGNPGDERYRTDINTNMLSFTLLSVGKTLLEIALSIITVLIVYFVLKFSVKFGGGSDFVSKKISGLQDTIGTMVGTLPVVPVPGYDAQGNRTLRGVGLNSVTGENSLISRVVQNRQSKINSKISEQNSVINSWFGDTTGYLSESEEKVITGVMMSGKGLTALSEVRTKINGMKDENGKGMKLNRDTASNNGLWIEQFEKWLEKSKGERIFTGDATNDKAWEDMINWWNDDKNKDNKTLENLFKRNRSGEAKSVKAYADFFGLSLTEDNWNYLKDADISKGTSTTTS